MSTPLAGPPVPPPGSHVDVAGREIKVGDYLMYINNTASSPRLQFARVTGCTRAGGSYNPNRPALDIQGAARHVGRWERLKPSRLTELDRTMVVTHDQVPAQALTLLAEGLN